MPREMVISAVPSVGEAGAPAFLSTRGSRVATSSTIRLSSLTSMIVLVDDISSSETGKYGGSISCVRISLRSSESDLGPKMNSRVEAR